MRHDASRPVGQDGDVAFLVEKLGYGGCAKSVTRAVHAIEPNGRGGVDFGTKLVTASGSDVSDDRFDKAIAAGSPAERA